MWSHIVWYSIVTRLGMTLAMLLLGLQDVDAGWGWFGYGGEHTSQAFSSPHKQGPELASNSRETEHGSKFDIESWTILSSNTRGKEIYGRSTSLISENTCWQLAYKGMIGDCRGILNDENKKSRLALLLTDCFLRASGRQGLRTCPTDVAAKSCVKNLDDHTHSIYLAFFIDAASMCHYLQTEEFKVETEILVNGLKQSADNTERKLTVINNQLDENHANVIEHTEIITEAQQRLSNTLTEAQQNLQREHALLQANIEKGMMSLQEAAKEAQTHQIAFNKIQKEIENKQKEMSDHLASELSDLQQKHDRLGASMSHLDNVLMHSMSHLETSVGELTEQSLLGQAKILGGQEEAMIGLSKLRSSQIDAMEEGRIYMEKLAAEAHKHQEDFRTWQMDLDDIHSRLVEGSANMVKAQESFVTKQAAVFTMLERLFSLNSTYVTESRAFKTMLVYLTFSIFVFMATTTKYTRNARLILYCGLIVMFIFEIWLIRPRIKDFHNDALRLTWTPQRIWWLRTSYGVAMLAYLFFNVFTFRDYETLNFKMLVQLHESIGELQGNMGILFANVAELRKNIVELRMAMLNQAHSQQKLLAEFIAHNKVPKVPNKAISLRPKVDHEGVTSKKVSRRASFKGMPPPNLPILKGPSVQC